MSQEKIWLSSPHMGEQERKFVLNAFDTNWIAPLGPHVNGFEDDLQKFTGAKHAAALSSGTAAIHLALVLLGVEPGDHVVCQSMTFAASANPIRYQKATPIFVDGEEETWNMSPQFLEIAIQASIKRNKKPKAIIPVHLYGMPAKMDELIQIAENYDIPIVEDAAEALGASYDNQRCGSFGKLGVLSFNGNKIITTSGGGALVSDDEGLIKKSRFLATQARDPAPHYQHSTVGYNYRMSNVCAGIGRGQMVVLAERVNQRRSNFERYFKYFQNWNQRGFDIIFQPELERSYSNRWLTCILVDPKTNRGLTREKIRLELAEENIEARPLWKPMHLQPVFQDFPFFGNGLSDKLFDIGLCLPSGSNLREEDFSRIFNRLDRIFEKMLQA